MGEPQTVGFDVGTRERKKTNPRQRTHPVELDNANKSCYPACITADRDRQAEGQRGLDPALWSKAAAQ